MKDFNGKVAVITGAASGIGRAIADCGAQKGVKLVLADIEELALKKAAAELEAAGAEVLSVRADVSKREDIELLAKKALDRFGAVHLLFNNAGVGAGSTVWESTLADWQWVIGVNLWGVIHGCQVFIPIMLQENTDCHVVNTASVAGLINGHPTAAYQVTKHAVVSLSEHLFVSLAQQKAKVKVSVLCPGWVQTRIMESDRNRPPEWANEPTAEPPGPEAIAVFQAMTRELQSGILPAQVADRVFDAIEQDKFYILTHDEYDPMIQARMESILQRRDPVV